MSDKNPEAQNATDETQLTDEGVESVSGGVTIGGCIPNPFEPCFPTIPDIIDGIGRVDVS